MRVGEYEIVPVLDGAVRMPPSRMFRNTTDADWEPHRALLGEDGLLELALGGFLIRGGTAGRVVLERVRVSETPSSWAEYGK